MLHADVGNPDTRIALEADSLELHTPRKAPPTPHLPGVVPENGYDPGEMRIDEGRPGSVRWDSWRHNEMTLAGWVVLHFAWEHVMFNPAWVRAVIAWVARQRVSYCSSLIA